MTSTEHPSHVVGVGASVGGAESLERLFGAFPPDTGMAFVVLQQLMPGRRRSGRLAAGPPRRGTSDRGHRKQPARRSRGRDHARPRVGHPLARRALPPGCRWSPHRGVDIDLQRRGHDLHGRTRRPSSLWCNSSRGLSRSGFAVGSESPSPASTRPRASRRCVPPHDGRETAQCRCRRTARR